MVGIAVMFAGMVVAIAVVATDVTTLNAMVTVKTRV